MIDTSADWRDTERAPHWSNSIEWADGRWDPISNAPRSHQRIRVRDLRGRVVENAYFIMHGARRRGVVDLNAGSWTYEIRGEQGQILSYGAVVPVEWQPMRAKP